MDLHRHNLVNCEMSERLHVKGNHWVVKNKNCAHRPGDLLAKFSNSANKQKLKTNFIESRQSSKCVWIASLREQNTAPFLVVSWKYPNGKSPLPDYISK